MEEARALLQEAMPAQQPVAQTGLASLMVRAALCPSLMPVACPACLRHTCVEVLFVAL